MTTGVVARILASQWLLAANRIAPVVSAGLLTMCALGGNVRVTMVPRQALPPKEKNLLDRFQSIGGG